MPVHLKSIADSFPDIDFFSLADRSKFTVDVSASDDVFLSAKQSKNGATFRRIVWDDGVTSFSRIISKDDFDLLKSEHVKLSRSGGGESRSLYRGSRKPKKSAGGKKEHAGAKVQSGIKKSRAKKSRHEKAREARKHTGRQSHHKKAREARKRTGKKSRHKKAREPKEHTGKKSQHKKAREPKEHTRTRSRTMRVRK